MAARRPARANASATAVLLQDALRGRGLRMTPQRQLVAEAVARIGGPLTVERVHHYVVRQFPDVHVSTVYRTLETLEELGFVSHTHSHSGVAHYHLRDDEPHQHLVCVGCGTEVELDPAVLEPLAAELRQAYRFEPLLGHTAIVGRCQACQACQVSQPGQAPTAGDPATI